MPSVAASNSSEKEEKRESRARKEEKAALKREKKDAKKAAAAALASKVDADEVQDGSLSEDEGSKKSKKKRKREEADADELEIDVSLPEPPSKKALRKAKKQKSQPAADGENEQGDGVKNGERNATDLAKVQGQYGIWIGNLPWTITKPMLAAFFTTNAEAMGSSIPNISIIRIHLPPPANARPDKAGIKPVNKGFAYVDFASEDVLKAALALSETPFAGRKVLIKEAKNFAGRPEKDVTQGATATPKADEARAGSSANQGKVTRRVFVGNLGFDVTKEDLEKHYATCGTVVDIHMATFEDTGKCKGFAWVTFEDTSAAEAAVRGWARVNEDEVEPDVEVEEQDSDKDQEEKPKKEKKPKTRKWFVNRLLGRQLRCEFAEDASTRYKKRFGKDAVNPKHSYGDENNEGSARATGTGAGESKMSGRDKRRAEKAASLGKHSTFAYGGDDESRYRTGGIAPAEGQKITFD